MSAKRMPALLLIASVFVLSCANRGSEPGSTGGSGSGGSSGGTGGVSLTGGTGGSTGSGATAGVNGNAGHSGSGGGGGTGGGTTGGSAGRGGVGAGGDGVGGTQGGGSGGAGAGGNGVSGCVPDPILPGAQISPLYAVTANGTAIFVEKLTKFSPEMQVHYAHCSMAGSGTATFAVTVSESFTSYTVSPKSRNIVVAKNGTTITFSSGPNYLVVQFDSKELLFILIDAPEVNPPRLGDANVTNIADLSVDNTGATLVTSKIQAAITAASGATKNIVYIPPGKYLVGELWLKSNMTLYLAGGAVLYGSSSTGDFNTGSGGINIEGAQHALIRMYQIKNTNLLGRGVLDSNGKAIRAQGLNANLLKIEQSSNILVDGIVARDPSYWNTLIYRSDTVTIQNYKVINFRLNVTDSPNYNQTDGVDFDESTNGILYNAFLYTGDDGMATKNEEASGTVNTKNIVHDKVVIYNNSAGCKIGTKTMGQSMDGVVFKDIDIVKAGRALAIDGADTAIVQNTTFQDVRIEAAGSLVDVQNNNLPTFRTAAGQTIIKETFFTNVSSSVRASITLNGESSSVNVAGVHFNNFAVQGKVLTSQTDANASWNINSFVSGITFQ